MVTQAMKFSSPVPVSSAIVCPCPQMVAKSTLSAPACWSARARLTSTVEAVSPWVMPVRIRQAGAMVEVPRPLESWVS